MAIIHNMKDINKTESEKYLKDEIQRLTQEMKEKSEPYNKEYEDLWEERIAKNETLVNLIKQKQSR